MVGSSGSWHSGCSSHSAHVKVPEHQWPNSWTKKHEKGRLCAAHRATAFGGPKSTRGGHLPSIWQTPRRPQWVPRPCHWRRQSHGRRRSACQGAGRQCVRSRRCPWWQCAWGRRCCCRLGCWGQRLGQGDWSCWLRRQRNRGKWWLGQARLACWHRWKRLLGLVCMNLWLGKLILTLALCMQAREQRIDHGFLCVWLSGPLGLRALRLARWLCHGGWFWGLAFLLRRLRWRLCQWFRHCKRAPVGRAGCELLWGPAALQRLCLLLQLLHLRLRR
mmetsp:Transcript_88062/g.204932  ORF Transcript_88062/g.204932 Transcript_88062/m.204932 type:complete len:274 (+) Transcript_88062:3-824(+)